MRIKDVVEVIDAVKVTGDSEGIIQGISYDSRNVRKGDLFVCKGVTGDGHRYAEDAYQKGARAFLIERELDIYHDDAAYIFTNDTKGSLSLVSRAFFGYPEKRLHTIAVTGTKGKTTTTYFIKTLLKACGMECGIIGTIYNIIGDDRTEADRTTPEGYDIQKMLRMMVDKDIPAAAMEVSSHALMLGRVSGMTFNTGIFTNLSQDHLDFHGNMDEYFRAKMRLFDHTENCIVNIDDAYGKTAADELRAKGKKVYSVSLADGNASFYGYDIKCGPKCTSFRIRGLSDQTFEIGMFGTYNIYNAMYAITAACLYGADPADMRESLLLAAVPGRQEKYVNTDERNVFIDYAHTPGSLKETLESFRGAVKGGRLIVLFGAGGDRDKTKRPLMGKVAGELADFVIITSDNPRTEKPEEIIKDIEAGIKNVQDARYTVICDRVEAIRYAVRHSGPDDIIILAGKGHETYQEINHIKHHLDEREILDGIFGR